MLSEWTQKICQWIQEHRDEMTADIIRLVRIRSVAEYDAAAGNYGKECVRALRTMLQMAQDYGFKTTNHRDIIGEIDLGYSGEPIGIWGHMDVVPEGDGWEYPPFEGIVERGLLIGRGAQDNKGQAVAVLYVMRCIRELGIPLSRNIRLYLGTDEEDGMEDITWFLQRHTVPSFCMVADSSFPVCYGEKGMITAEFTGGRLSGEILGLQGGTAANVVPGSAGAQLRRTERVAAALPALRTTVQAEELQETVQITAEGTPGHAAFPQHSVNAVRVLTHALCESGALCEADRAVLSFADRINQDCFGGGLGIGFEDEMSGRLTCVGSVLSLRQNRPCLTVNIRYPVTDDGARIIRRMRCAAEENGYELKVQKDDPAHCFPREHPAVEILMNVYRRVTGLDREPFVMAGGTYSRKLRNSISFGMGMPGMNRPDIENRFAAGHGGAHGPDEYAVLEDLMTGIRIYTESMIALNGIKL